MKKKTKDNRQERKEKREAKKGFFRDMSPKDYQDRELLEETL